MRKHLSIRVEGRVQGVFYRASARQKATELGLHGFARNEDDGSVYIEVEGEEQALNEFLQWCKTGPPRAEVKALNHHEGAFQNLTGFSTH
jgi:acylphosphatase